MKDLISQLKTMSFEKPESIIHGLDLLHFHFSTEDYNFSISNKIIKLGNEFTSIEMTMDEKIKILNSIFFEKENLVISSDDESSVYLKHLFENHVGDLNLVSMVYQYFLKKLEIKFSIWSPQQAHLIKVFDHEKTYVINLKDKGLRAKGKDLSEPPEETPSTLQMQLYFLLSKMADQLLIKSHFQNTLKIYNCILEIFPEKVMWYARRGLLKKNLGQYQEALNDLEKYSHYVSEKDFSTTIIQAFVELKGLKYVQHNPALSH